MSAASAALGVSAHNIANQETADFRRQELSRSATPGGGVVTAVQQASRVGKQLETDVVAQLAAKHAFLANLAVFKAADAMAGRLLHLRA